MTTKDLLKEAGLSEREAKVYLALLGLGLTTTGPIVKKSTVPNSKIYEILESLESKGLASHIIKKKTKYFQAADPNKLLVLHKEKQRDIASLIPKLKAKQLTAKHRQSTELFEGLPAIRSMLAGLIDNARKGEAWYGFSTGKSSDKEEIKAFYEWWGKRKNIAGLKDHLLISKKHKTTFEKAHKGVIKKLSKVLRYSKISFPGDVAIFRDKVVLLNWDEPSTAILISSKNLAAEYKDFFLGLWKMSK